MIRQRAWMSSSEELGTFGLACSLSLLAHSIPMLRAEKKNWDMRGREVWFGTKGNRDPPRLTGNKSIKKSEEHSFSLPHQHQCTFLPQLNRGINSNCSELFTTCTHHTHRPAHRRQCGSSQSASRFQESSRFLIQSECLLNICDGAHDQSGSFHMWCWLRSVRFKSSFPRLQ